MLGSFAGSIEGPEEVDVEYPTHAVVGIASRRLIVT